MHKYEIIDIIDQGAYGIVWKATNKETQQLVAIKEFKQTDEDQDTKRTIQREIRMLKMLKSDHVVGIREAFKKKGKIYLIFEYFPLNLLNLIQQDQQGLQPQAIKNVVYHVVRCLNFLHKKNVIHRDIKPQNILISQDHKTLKLCDFGFARFIPQNLKQLTDYVATRWYRSPQLLVGEPYHKPSDMFALGCIIGQLVDGQPMFPGEDQVDQLFLLRKALGELTEEQHSYMMKNEKYANVQLEPIKKRQTLQERYIGKIEKNALSFMKSCLKMDSAQRLTAEQALKHPYLLQLSTRDNIFQNDELNLLSNDRKTVPKTQMRVSVMSLIKEDQDDQHNDTKLIENSLMLSKDNKVNETRIKLDSRERGKKNGMKGNYGSVDYTSTENTGNSMLAKGQYQSNQMLMKKTSHHALLQGGQHHVQTKPKKISLKKNLSQQKHMKVNLDVNVNINLKFNHPGKKSHFSQKQPPMLFNNNRLQKIQRPDQHFKQQHKLPELKPKGFMLRKKDQALFGIQRLIGEKNNLSIHGHSKEITKNLLNRKLAGLMGH